MLKDPQKFKTNLLPGKPETQFIPRSDGTTASLSYALIGMIYIVSTLELVQTGGLGFPGRNKKD